MLKLFFIPLILLASCSVKYITNQDGGLRPKKENFFKYKGDYKLTSTDNIDTNAIYLRHLGPIWYSNKDSVKDAVAFYRFYSSGHLYMSPLYDSVPSLSEINNIKTGNVGFYKIIDGKIKIEYLYYVDIGSRKTMTGHIENGNLILNDTNKKTIWTKTVINGLTHTKPDW